MDYLIQMMIKNNKDNIKINHIWKNFKLVIK